MARLWRASRVEAVGVVCSLSRSWPAYESLPVNVLPSFHHGPTTRFSSFVRWFYRAIHVQGVSWVSPVQVRDWTPFEAHLIDQVLMKMIRPPLWRFLYYQLLANDVHLVVHSSTEARYRADVSRLSSRAEIARGSLGQLGKPTDVTYK